MPIDRFKELAKESDRFEVLASEEIKPQDRFESIADEQKKPGLFQQAAGEAIGSTIGAALGPAGMFIGPYIGKKAVEEISKTDIKESMIQGGRQSATGILLGLADSKKISKENQSMLGHFAEIITEMGMDLPLMAIAGAYGAKPGAAAGGLIGSAFPGAGTAIGAAAGGAVTGGATALAVPQLIKSTYDEYRDFVEKGGSLSFGEFLERAARVGKEAGKSAITGAALGAMGRLSPLLSKVPGFSKVMNSKPGAMAVETAAELAGLTGVTSAMEGELPTSQSVADNLVVLLGMKLATGAAGKTKKFFTELASPETKTRGEAFLKLLPEETQKYVKEKYPEFGEKTQKEKFRQILRDNLGERNAKIYETQTELSEAFEKAQGKEKFKPKQLEEATYYKQKTGNPFVEGDTFEKLSERLPKNLKNFIDKDVTNHFAKMADMWNKNTRTKNINPRDVLREIYMPGLYEYDTKQFNKAYDKLTKKFNINNPFEKPKEYLTFLDAFRAEGLKPRYKNFMDFVNAYNNKVIKTVANVKLLEDISEHQKGNPEPIVVTTFDGKSYKDAKAAGYVPFDDLFLRTHKLQPAGEGKVAQRMWKTSDAPALVHPDFADTFRGVFSKEAYSSETGLGKALKLYDQASDLARYTRVEMSPFHYFSLMESAIGSGIATKHPNWYSEGGRLRQNKAIMADAIKHGLKLDYRITETGGKKGLGVVSKGLQLMKKGADNLPDNLASRGAQKGLAKIASGSNHLFEEFHPRLKLSTYNHYVNQEVMRRIKAGENLTDNSVKLMKQGIADFTNNIYGGQNWEYMQFFNDPAKVKNVRRFVGYPDWSISTVRQALDASAPGVKGKIARQYWKRYGIGLLGINGALKFLNSGIVQTDDKDNSIKGLWFDVNRGFEGLFKGGPRALYTFPLPDVNVRLPFTNKVINPGRDWNGFKLIGHFGKQALELGNYFTNTVSAFYSKSNPLIQDIVNQIWGGSPKAGGEIWKAEAAKDKYGKMKPWGAKESFIGQVPYRILNVIKNKLPFSAQTLQRTGFAPFAASLFGAYPLSKAINTYTARPFLEDAFYSEGTGDRNRKLDSIEKLMKEGGLSDKTIKQQIGIVRNAVEIDKVKADLESAVKNNDTPKITKIRTKLLRRGIGARKINNLIKRLKAQ